MSRDGVSNVAVNFVTSTILNRMIGNGLKAAVYTVLTPVQLGLDVGIAAATTITTYLIMTAASLALSGTFYVVKEAANGVYQVFFEPKETYPMIENPKETWDNCDAELSSLGSSAKPIESFDGSFELTPPGSPH